MESATVLPTAPPERRFGGPALPPIVIRSAVILAALLPVVLLALVILTVVGFNYSFFNWME